MKVAVISGTGTQCSKSTLIITLATVFAATQKKVSMILSTEEMSDVLDMVQYKRSKSVLSSASVLSSVLHSEQSQSMSIFDYGLRVGDSNTFLYDIFDSTYDKVELGNILLDVLKRAKSDLTLVEVKGDLNSELNQEILDTVDCILYLFDASQKSIKQVQYYKQNMSKDIVVRTGYVCAKFDRNVVDENKLAKMLGITVRELLVFPYNAVLQKLALTGTLNMVTDHIILGHAETTNLRIRMLEMMQYLFDTGSWHYIKGVDEWIK